MKYKNILLIGASGTLGQEVSKLNFPNLFTPTSTEFNITIPYTIRHFFNKHDVDAIIYCAGLARMKKCEDSLLDTLRINTLGVGNVVKEIMHKHIRFIHISTDGVYNSSEGNYFENSATIPYSKYGWSKLGEECIVNLLQNFCIIRTSFFSEKNITFNYSPEDAYTSKTTISYLARAIQFMLNKDFVGTINISGEKTSYYDLYKEYKPSLKPCKLNDILKETPFLAKDASMNISLWKIIREEWK